MSALLTGRGGGGTKHRKTFSLALEEIRSWRCPNGRALYRRLHRSHQKMSTTNSGSRTSEQRMESISLSCNGLGTRLHRIFLAIWEIQNRFVEIAKTCYTAAAVLILGATPPPPTSSTPGAPLWKSRREPMHIPYDQASHFQTAIKRREATQTIHPRVPSKPKPRPHTKPAKRQLFPAAS